MALLAAATAVLVPSPAATAAQGDWIGTIRDRQVIDQSDGAATETYTSVWTIGPAGDAYTFTLTGQRRSPTEQCGVVVSTYESAGTGAGSVNLLVSADPAGPSGESMRISSTTGAGTPLLTRDQSCVQYAPGLWRVESSETTTTFFPYPVNDHPRCPDGIAVPRGAQAVQADVTCTAGDTTGTWSVTARRAVCDSSVDSDGGGIGDCREFERGSHPGLRADDGAALPPPVQGKRVNVRRVSGVVLVRRPGRRAYAPLRTGEQIPVGSLVDATNGRVRLESATGASGANLADFYDGRFRVLQRGGQSLTRLVIQGRLTCASPGARRADARRRKPPRRLWGEGSGDFQTIGRNSAATVRGTTWLVQDRCDGTLTRVRAGRVAVRDLVTGRTTTLRAGQSYLARNS